MLTGTASGHMTASHPEITEIARQARSSLDAGDLTTARRLCARVCAIETGNAEAWLLLGRIHAREGNPQQAENCLRQAIALDPANADACNRLAGILLAQKRLAEAEENGRRALDLDPGKAEIHANLGNVLAAQGRQQEAADCYRHALRLNPDFLGARLNLANTLRSMRQYLQAAGLYRSLLEANPGFIEVYNALGECYLEAGMLEVSLDCYREAVRLKPGYLQAHINMGFVQGLMQDYGGALACYRRALQLAPARADLHLSLGLVEKRLGDPDAAASSYRRALELDPRNPDAQLALGLVELMRGNFTAGWKLYTARKSVRKFRLEPPAVLDQELTGSRIFVVKDQGIGDEIFFLRFVRLLKARGAWIAYRTDPKIRTLVERLPFLDAVVDGDVQAPGCGLQLSTGDLPLCLGFGDDTPIPPPVELAALPSAVAVIGQLLEELGPGPYTGVTWWAGTKHEGSLREDPLAYREVPLELIASVLRPLQTTVLVLQRDPDPDEICRLSGLLGRPVHDLSRFNDDLEGMLALLSRLTEYIGVDNTNMHLAASIGKPCRILVPHPPEWRVMSEGNHSPWFPGFSLYRQRANGDWNGAFRRLAEDLDMPTASETGGRHP